MDHRRITTRRLLALGTVLVLLVLASPGIPAQQTRTLTITLDSLRLNVCGPKSFLMPVWAGDIPVSDSLFGMQFYFSWDKVNLDLEDFVILSSETIVRPGAQNLVYKDAANGTLLVQLGVSGDVPIAGSGKPLFYLRGGVIAPDTLAGLNGWIDIISASFISSTTYDPIIRRAGLVHVFRDTTAGFTGRMSVGAGSFDTTRTDDTVTLTIENLGNRRVKEIEFTITGDTNFFAFVDTVERGTLAARNGWSVKDVRITADTVIGRLVSDSVILEEGALLGIILRRRSDSAFTRPLNLARFEVNQTSCLGKLERTGAQVTAEAIPDTASPMAVEPTREASKRLIQVIPSPQNGSVRVTISGFDARNVEVFDAAGRRVGIEPVERIDASTLLVRFMSSPSSGVYFIALRDRTEIVYKQFTFIK